MNQVCTVPGTYSTSLDAAFAGSKTGQVRQAWLDVARSSKQRNIASSSDSEEGFGTCCLKDLDELYEQVRSQNRLLADRYKIKLIKRAKLNTSKDEQMTHSVRGSLWHISEKTPPASPSLLPKAAPPKRRMRCRAEDEVLFTSKDRANAWIAEHAPKSTLLLMEREVWVQQKEKRKRERRAQSRALRALQRRAVPFDQWTVHAKEAEEVADIPIVEVDRQELAESWAQAEPGYMSLTRKAFGSKQAPDHQEQEPEPIYNLSMLRKCWKEQHGMAAADLNKKYENLLEEFMLGLCKLQRNVYGNVERIVNVTAFNVQTSDNLSLVQVGFWREGKLTPSCMLPATKQEANETPEDALQRILRTEYKPLDGLLKVVNQNTQTHWHHSPSYGVRTKYTRTLIHARIDGDAHAIKLPKALKITRTRVTPTHDDQDLELPGIQHRPASVGRKSISQHASCPRGKVYDHQLYLTWRSNDIKLSAWLQAEEFEYLRSPEGERQLKFLVQSVKVDPTLLPKRDK